MTSWKARIDNVIPVVKDLLERQTVKPDLVVINLSLEEFRDAMPTQLMQFAECNPKVSIHWMEGPNLRQWKKIIPTLLMFPNDAVVCIDDDWMYSPKFLETLVKAHMKYPNNPVTINKGFRVKGCLQHCGCGTLDKLSYYPGLWDIDLTELSEEASSDTFFTLLAHDRGNDIMYVGSEVKKTPYRSVLPLSKSEKTSDGVSHMRMYNYMVSKGIIKPIV